MCCNSYFSQWPMMNIEPIEWSRFFWFVSHRIDFTKHETLIVNGWNEGNRRHVACVNLLYMKYVFTQFTCFSLVSNSIGLCMCCHITGVRCLHFISVQYNLKRILRKQDAHKRNRTNVRDAFDWTLSICLNGIDTTSTCDKLITQQKKKNITKIFPSK